VVSELVGHSRSTITLDLYSHVAATMQQQAAIALDQLFGGQLDSQIASATDETAGKRP
jgi:hypothetical protein